MTEDLDRTPAVLADIARFAATARRVVSRDHDCFIDPDDDDQRRIARSLLVDLSAAADRLPESFRQAYPEIDWRGIRSVRNFVAHDYHGTDEEILWQAISVQFPAIVSALLPT
ncbi:HepT-like ribonuclease domain-containing protein [Rathayibacter soli]|uniref:HepT-like ribonuclease domain-containing protein n=1 Tax=Rathayibacter soli TaxID=3144168 RepID=UPI0027E44166|nr:HepT-like ribonuclease domain-containing protein [Glaciibacter superstes]